MSIITLRAAILRVPRQLFRFRVAVFLILLAILYGYLIWRIGMFNSVGPDQAVLNAQASSSQPHIDPATINKIKQLQDNSVNVQTLFNQARQNPFQE